MLKKGALIYPIILATSLIFTGCSSKSVQGTSESSNNWQNAAQGIQMKSKFSEVKVSTDVFSVHFDPSPDELTHISLTSSALDELKKKFNFEMKETKDQLEINIEGKKGVVSLDSLGWDKTWNAELHIQLPANEYKKINIESHVGRIEYNQVDSEQLKVSNDVGEILIQDTNIKQTNIKSSVGLVKMNNVNGKIDVSNRTGSVQIKLQSIQDDINVTTSLGAVTIVLEEEPKQVNLNLSTEIGSIETNLEMNYDKKTRRTITGSKGVNGPKIKVDSEVGKIEVNSN